MVAQTADFDGRPGRYSAERQVGIDSPLHAARRWRISSSETTRKSSVRYWNTDRALETECRPHATSPLAGAIGHFLCLDGFGAPSDEEASAGIPFLGEASKLQFETALENRDARRLQLLKLKARLPLAQEDITRTITLLDGENVVYVNTEVENLLAIDHPISWAEHATTGPPFLSPGQTIIDIPATQCRVRPQKAGSTGKLAYGKDFVWPMGPAHQRRQL